MVDVATGQVMASGVSTAASSLTEDVLTPFLSLMTTGGKQKPYFVVLKKGPHFPYSDSSEASEDGAVIMNYGNVLYSFFNLFVQSLLLYLILGVWTRCVAGVCRR